MTSELIRSIVDVIYPAFPLFYVTNPEYIRLLLEPIMQYLASGRWKQPYTIHDIGASYPNATGHDDQAAEAQPVEECGNLLILMYGEYPLEHVHFLCCFLHVASAPGHEATAKQRNQCGILKSSHILMLSSQAGLSYID